MDSASGTRFAEGGSIEVVDGVKVLHVDLSDTARGQGHKQGPGGIVLGREQLEKILASGAETVEYDGCNATSGLCEATLKPDSKTLSNRLGAVSLMHGHWLIAFFLLLALVMLLVWLYSPRQRTLKQSKPKQQQANRRKKQGKIKREGHHAKEERKKDK